MFPPGFWWGLAVGLGASLAVGLALYWMLRWLSSRATARAHAEVEEVPNGADSARLSVPVPPPRPTQVSVPATIAGPDPPAPAVDAVSGDTRSANASDAAGPSVGSPRAHYSRDQLRTSLRILIHLSRFGNSNPGEIPTRPATQAGMVEALGVTQGALTSALSRLVSGGLLEVERSHVVGSDRRLKVYRLTARGRSLAIDLRRRGARGPSPAAATEPELARRVPVPGNPTHPSG